MNECLILSSNEKKERSLKNKNEKKKKKNILKSKQNRHRLAKVDVAQCDIALHDRVVCGLVDARLAMSRNDVWNRQRNRSLSMVSI